MNSGRGTILVTGGGGYIGAHLTHYLLDQGISPADLIVFDTFKQGRREFVPAGVKVIVGDLRDKETIATAFSAQSIESVFHLAGLIEVAESARQPGKYFEHNVYGTLNLLEAMRKASCKEIVFSSTCAVYGLPETVPIVESSACQPSNPYGESKHLVEKLLDYYQDAHGIKSVRLRYFNAAGAGYGIGEVHHPETHLIPLVLQAAHSGDRVSVFGSDYDTVDGTCLRDYVHVLDIAAAHLPALDFLRAGDRIAESFNLGSGNGLSIRKVIELVQSIVGRQVNVIQAERRSGDIPVLIADTTKAKQILGWSAQRSAREIISSAWAWQQAAVASQVR